MNCGLLRAITKRIFSFVIFGSYLFFFCFSHSFCSKMQEGDFPHSHVCGTSLRDRLSLRYVPPRRCRQFKILALLSARWWLLSKQVVFAHLVLASHVRADLILLCPFSCQFFLAENGYGPAMGNNNGYQVCVCFFQEEPCFCLTMNEQAADLPERWRRGGRRKPAINSPEGVSSCLPAPFEVLGTGLSFPTTLRSPLQGKKK